MRISVIVTAYNYARYLRQAVDSVLLQTHRPARVVVVDDGSTDDTAQLLRDRYVSENLVTVVRQDNAGQIAAAQRGLSRCQGDIVCFLDGDDWWEPEYLATLARLYASDPGIDYIYGNMRLRGVHEGRLLLPSEADYDTGISTLVTLILGQGLSTATSAVSLRDRLARMVLRIPRSIVRDWRIGLDTCLACGSGLMGARKYYLGSALVNYRLHDANNFFARPQSRSEALQDYMRLRRLLRYYAQAAFLGNDSIEWIRQEFQTRPAPSWEDTVRYLRIACSESVPVRLRVRYAASILRHFVDPGRSVRKRPSAG